MYAALAPLGPRIVGGEELALASAGGVVDRGREVGRRTENLMRLLAALRHKDPASAANDPH